MNSNKSFTRTLFGEKPVTGKFDIDKQLIAPKFRETDEGYSIPVLNEREIRAVSGILFLFALLSLLMIVFKKDFILAKFFVLAFLLDFSLSVFVSSKHFPLRSF